MLDKLKNKTRIASALFLTLAGLWAYSVFAELDAWAVESEGIYYVALSLRAMVKEQKRGQLPSKQEFLQWSKTQRSVHANDRPDFAWNGMAGSVSNVPQRVIVWSQRGLGPFWRRYYDAVFDDLTVRRVPASRLEAVLNGQAFALNERYECVHRCK